MFSLLSNLPVRFRVYDQAKPYWVANIAVINLLRAPRDKGAGRWLLLRGCWLLLSGCCPRRPRPP